MTTSRSKTPSRRSGCGEISTPCESPSRYYGEQHAYLAEKRQLLAAAEVPFSGTVSGSQPSTAVHQATGQRFGVLTLRPATGRASKFTPTS